MAVISTNLFFNTFITYSNEGELSIEREISSCLNFWFFATIFLNRSDHAISCVGGGALVSNFSHGPNHTFCLNRVTG